MCLLVMIMQVQGSAWLPWLYQGRRYLTAHNLAFHLLGGLGHGDSVLPLLLDPHHCLLATEHILLDVTSHLNLLKSFQPHITLFARNKSKDLKKLE